MQLSSKTPTNRTGLLYITIGGIAIVWTVIWIIYLYNHPPHSSTTYYLCAGCLCTSIIVLLIGFSMDPLFRAKPEVVNPPTPPQPVHQPQITLVPMVTQNANGETNGQPTPLAAIVSSNPDSAHSTLGEVAHH